ncbi:MAG: hypothetical protein AB7Q37_18545 [Pyrinomonadaceae bacterium]
MNKRHLIIPDAQVKPGVATEHVDWAARAIVDYKPDTVVVIGDWWDFPSLNSHVEKGSAELEGARFEEDLLVGNEAFKRLCAPMEAEIARLERNRRRRWKPRKVFLKGNHEDRADRVAKAEPRWEGVIGSHLCDTRDFGVHKYLDIVDIDGIAYSHYFQSAHSHHPIGGSIENRLNKIGRSFVQGHQQGFLYGVKQFPGNIIRHGLVAGSFYLHDEGYRGPQGNGEWRGIVVLNEVRDGQYDIMPLSMDYLRRKYGI